MWRRVRRALDSAWFARVALAAAWLWLITGVVITSDMIWHRPEVGKPAVAGYVLLVVILWHNAIDATRDFRTRFRK